MKEYNFKVTTIEKGWVEIHANDETEAKLILKTKYPDTFELSDAQKWKEGKVVKVELQKEDEDEDITHLYI